jgi:ubiquinone/menaquinone biosynthesis C-methylase UbiE
MEDARMAQPKIHFDDGHAYEQSMGVWSRLAGEIFLDWLAPSPDLRWVDVGCGSGAFTELIVQLCAPSEVQAIDPSDGQLAFARTREGARTAEFRTGDAMALPFAAQTFDTAVMALVLVFVPDPSRGVAEMRRVVRPGGTVAAYMWDMLGGGFPGEPMLAAMREMDLSPPRPPHMDASQLSTMRELWTNAGLDAVETRELTVTRSFDDFEQWWQTTLKSASIAPIIAAMSADGTERLKSLARTKLPMNEGRRLSFSARANAIKGRRPN